MKHACRWASALLRIDCKRESSAGLSVVTTDAGILGTHWCSARSMLEVLVSKSDRMLLALSWPGLAISSLSRLRLTSTKLASRCTMGHRSATRPKSVSTAVMAERSSIEWNSCGFGTRIVPDMGEDPKERAEATSKYRKARSRKALVGLRLPLRSLIIDNAPLKWLFSTVDEPLRTIYRTVNSTSTTVFALTHLIIQQ